MIPMMKKGKETKICEYSCARIYPKNAAFKHRLTTEITR